MAREDDSQAADQLSREAEQLLAEYFRIRREYNALDRDNPSHAGRRAELKARYHELDRKYTQLVQSQDERVEARQGPTHSRADILWEGATQSPARINEPVEPELESRSADEAWIELTTPVEGPATDRMFEEALRQIGEKTPQDPPRSFEFAPEPHIDKPTPIAESSEPDADTPTPFPETVAFETEADEAAEPALETPEAVADTPTPFPETATFETEAAEPALEAPEADDRANGLDRPVAQKPFAVDALRELTEHLRSGALDDIDRELAERTPVPAEAPSASPTLHAEPYVEIDHVPRKPVLPLTQTRSHKRADDQPKETAHPIACVSCGERLPAGTLACRYCGARIVSADTAEGIADAILPHLQIQLSEPKPRPNLGSKALILLGWLLVLAAAAWLMALNTNYRIDDIHEWLGANGMSMLRKDQSGGIFGVSITLLGGTLIGIGIFATRFVRVIVSMHELARNGRVESIEKLIVEGAELDQRDERGCTPLHFAVVAKQREVVAVLVGNGADVNSHNNRGDTPLHMAVANRDHALVQYFLKRGADAETINDGGSTLMHVAAQVGDVGLLKIFAERGLAIDQKTNVGFTPLHFAAQSGHDGAIEFLVEHGADPNAASDHGTTAIFPAVRNGHLNSVRLLVEAGADYNARRGHDFESPLGIARVHKRREIYEYLESIGAEG